MRGRDGKVSGISCLIWEWLTPVRCPDKTVSGKLGRDEKVSGISCLIWLWLTPVSCPDKTVGSVVGVEKYLVFQVWYGSQWPSTKTWNNTWIYWNLGFALYLNLKNILENILEYTGIPWIFMLATLYHGKAQSKKWIRANQKWGIAQFATPWLR